MLVLVRHAESSGNAQGRLVGRADVPLTPRGRQQIEDLSRVLAPAVRVISSPLRRAVETGEGLGLGPPVETDDRWIEIDYGELDHRPLAEVPGDLWRHWRADPSYEPPGGESLVEVGRRVRDACEELFAREGEGARRTDGDVVVVSHVSPIKAAVAWALGQPDDLVWRLQLSTGSITRIGWTGSHPILHTYNASPDPSAP